MKIEERIDKYLTEDKNFPKLWGKSLSWTKSKQKGYWKINLPAKNGEIEIEWSPEDPEYINWAEITYTKKGKPKYGDSGQDEIDDFEKDFKKIIDIKQI